MIRATKIELIAPPAGRRCARCGTSIQKHSRPGGRCSDCLAVERLETSARMANIDLAEMDDDLILELIEMSAIERGRAFESMRRAARERSAA